MIIFKKGISIKIISIFITLSFVINSNVYPNTLTAKSILRKPLDFNDNKDGRSRYQETIQGDVHFNPQLKVDSARNNNITPVRRGIFGIMAGSFLFLSYNLIRYFVITPNYLESLRYGSIITAVILTCLAVFFIVPQVITGRAVFNNKENKGSNIKLVMFIAVIIFTIVPNIFFTWQGNSSLHYIRHEIVTPMLGSIDKTGDFDKGNRTQEGAGIQHSVYTVDHNLGGMYQAKETVHIILVPQESVYEVGVEAIEGKIPFKGAVPDRIAEGDPSVIIKASGGYSKWDSEGKKIWNASLVIKNGKVISEHMPNKKGHILVITNTGKMIISSTEDYINKKYPFDGSEKDLDAIHVGFPLMINGQSTGFAETFGDIEQNRSWGIVFQCVDKNGKRKTGFFYSSGVVKGISGTPLSQIYKFITGPFAVEHNIEVTDIMVLESGGFSFIDAELPKGDSIHGGSNEARATSILVVKDLSLVDDNRRLADKAKQSSEDFYSVYISPDTKNIAGFLQVIEYYSPKKVNKLLQGLTERQLFDLLKKSISVYSYGKQQILKAILNGARADEKEYINMLERLMLEAGLGSTELINTAIEIGAEGIAKNIVREAVKEMVAYKIGYYRSDVSGEVFYGKGSRFKCISKGKWASLGIEVRDGRNIRAPISLYGKQIGVKIKNNGDEPVRIKISVRSINKVSYGDLIVLKETVFKSNMADTIYIGEDEIKERLRKRGYDIENISIVVENKGDIEVEELEISDVSTGNEVILLEKAEPPPVNDKPINPLGELPKKQIQKSSFSYSI